MAPLKGWKSSKYLETTVTNQNSIQEEIKSILKSGNAFYHSVQNLLSSSLLSKNIKNKVYLFTYLLNPWSRVLPDKVISSQLVMNFPTFYRTWWFITTNPYHLSLSWATLIQSMPSHPTSWRSVVHIILPFTSGSSKWPLSLRFPHHNHVCTSTVLHASYMPSPSLRDLIAQTV